MAAMAYNIHRPRLLQIFEQLECSDEDRKNLCRLTEPRNSVFYEARRYYRPRSMGEKNECDNGWILNDNPIGEPSHYGSIFFSTCNDNEKDKKYVAKVIKYNPELTDMLQEMVVQQYVYDHCPILTIPIYQIFAERNNEFVIMITDFIQGSTVKRKMMIKLSDFSSENVKYVKNLLIYCKKLLKYLNKTCNVHHGDSHLNNFMILPDNSVKIIDFGNGEILEGKDEAYKEAKYMNALSILNVSFSMIMTDMEKNTGKKYSVMIRKILDDTNTIFDNYNGLELPVLEL